MSINPAIQKELNDNLEYCNQLADRINTIAAALLELNLRLEKIESLLTKEEQQK